MGLEVVLGLAGVVWVRLVVMYRMVCVAAADAAGGAYVISRT